MGGTPCKTQALFGSSANVGMNPGECMPSAGLVAKKACADPFVTEPSDMFHYNGSTLSADEDVGCWKMVTIAEVCAEAKPHRVLSNSQVTRSDCLKLVSTAEDMCVAKPHHACWNHTRRDACESVVSDAVFPPALALVVAAAEHHNCALAQIVPYPRGLEQQQRYAAILDMASTPGTSKKKSHNSADTALVKKYQRRSCFWIALTWCFM
mmetsp:Transcript_70965/g.140885  ORF Transcript_70965/g.140885 Transcript_70965/m.140885 type:complete len:209 (+) Transcript_70965:21-647(+)